MSSPSRRAQIRKVPCVAGCDGPMLTYIGVVLISGRSSPSSKSSRFGSTSLSKSADEYGARAAPWRAESSSLLECLSLILAGLVQFLGHIRRCRAPLSAHQGIILAQGVADELVVRQQSFQTRMPDEIEAEHLEGFTLGPVGGLPQIGRGGHIHLELRHRDLDAHAQILGDRVEVVAELETLAERRQVRAVDARNIQQQIEAMFVAQIREHIVDDLALDRDRAIAEAAIDVEDRACKPVAQILNQRVVACAIVFHSGSFIFSTTSCRRGRPREVTGSLSMRSCSLMIASRTASGRGGQPGMNTSTGMIWSMPCTVA